MWAFVMNSRIHYNRISLYYYTKWDFEDLIFKQYSKTYEKEKSLFSKFSCYKIAVMFIDIKKLKKSFLEMLRSEKWLSAMYRL